MVAPTRKRAVHIMQIDANQPIFFPNWLYEPPERTFAPDLTCDDSQCTLGYVCCLGTGWNVRYNCVSLNELVTSNTSVGPQNSQHFVFSGWFDAPGSMVAGFAHLPLHIVERGACLLCCSLFTLWNTAFSGHDFGYLRVRIESLRTLEFHRSPPHLDVKRSV